jgi:hypothetical protein
VGAQIAGAQIVGERHQDGGSQQQTDGGPDGEAGEHAGPVRRRQLHQAGEGPASGQQAVDIGRLGKAGVE